jgi:hypothetical protein
MQLMMSGLGALIMVAICGLSVFFIIAEERRDHGAAAAARQPIGVPGSPPADTRPLSLEEVFPGPEIRVLPGTGPYLVGMTHIDTDCASATTGLLGGLLDDIGCTQVVRAYLTAPYGGYQVTAGAFNLADPADAVLASGEIGRHVEAGDGSFAAMASVQPLAQVGWRDRGHFLLYCVITRPDGQLIRDDDPYARRIAGDLVETYLGETIIDKRGSNP